MQPGSSNLLLERDLEDAILGGDGSGVTLLKATYLLVVEVGSLPEGVIAEVESSPGVVESVKEYKL